jgi:hypothetical protein
VSGDSSEIHTLPISSLWLPRYFNRRFYCSQGSSYSLSSFTSYRPCYPFVVMRPNATTLSQPPLATTLPFFQYITTSTSSWYILLDTTSLLTTSFNPHYHSQLFCNHSNPLPSLAPYTLQPITPQPPLPSPANPLPQTPHLTLESVERINAL